MSTQFDYDVFISHSSKDKPVVRELANRLKQDGLRVWLDEWEIQPGDMIGLKIQQGLERSRTLLMVMSSAYFASEWSTLEHHTLLFRDPTNTQRRFIPLLIEDCKLPDAIAQFAYIDRREKSEEAYARILAACRLVEELIAESHTLKKGAEVMRDDFTDEVKRITAARVGSRCSNPSCRALTSEPQIDPSQALNVGVAAHITAASPGGPRYNPVLKPEARGHFTNAIWLCQNCAKLAHMTLLTRQILPLQLSTLRHWNRFAIVALLLKV